MRRTLAPIVALVAAALAPAPSARSEPRLPPLPAALAPLSATAEPLAGSIYDDDQALPAHAIDVADYTLRATLDPVGHVVHGEGTIVWRNASTQPVRELWVHLYMNAFKNEHSAFLREHVGGRGSEPPQDWGWIDVRKFALVGDEGTPVDLWSGAERHRAGDDDETDARVPLPRAFAPGEIATLLVSFDDKLPAVLERTGYRGTFHMVGQWFPKIARLEPDGGFAHFPFHHLAEFYADFGTYDVTLDVPERFVLGATGPVVEEHVAGGRRIERHVQSDVHDFAWTAWDRWQSLTETIDGVAVKLLYPPGFARLAEREMAALRFALPSYSARYGRYPYAVLTVVHPQQDASEAGGMEYPTLITTGGAWFTPPGVLAPEIVTVHELGHQWFYGLVATNELAWPFLDEGLNQFAECETMGLWRGNASAIDFAGLSVSDAAINAVFGNLAVHDEPVAQPADAFESGANYARLVYSRTASVVETLARVYGRELVDRALGRYARSFRFAHPGPEDLVRAIADVVGQRAASTLRTALFDEGWVDYAVEGVWAEQAQKAAGVFDCEGAKDGATPCADSRWTVPRDQTIPSQWENAVAVRRRGTLSFPVDIELVMRDGSRRRESWDGQGSFKRIAWRGPIGLRSAIVDPDDRVPIDSNLENNRASTPDGNRPSAPRTLERVVYWMQLALQSLSP